MRSRICYRYALLAILAIFAGSSSVGSALDGQVKDVPYESAPDMSFLNQPYNQCKVTPKELSPLNPAEKCWIGKLSARCSSADDCLVACLASMKARDLGGGCWHTCFQVKYPISKWTEPKGADSCRKLGKVPGI